MGIEIKTGKVVEPKIYAYTTPQVTTNDGWIKIGYTERDVETRIREQTHTAAIETELLWNYLAEYVEGPDKGLNFKDHDFHSFLKFHDIERRPKTEWFYFNGEPEKSEDLFIKFIQHDVSGYQPGKSNEYTLRREQDEAVTKTVAYFTRYENSAFLWNAKPRFGKTLSAYDLVKRLGVTNVLVLTNRPAVANSWYDDFDQFIAGNTEYKFVSSTDSLKDRPSMSREQFIEYLSEHDEAKQIAFISLQDLKGSKYFGGEYDKLKWVADLHWDLVIIDEAHEAVDTRKSDFAFSNIHRRWTLYLSGTPFKSIAKGQFSDEQIYNWSYADEQQAKKNWDSTCESENPYEVLPQLNMFTYQMSKMVLDVINDGVTVDGENYDYAFDLNEFFATNESGEFIHKDAVEVWLNTLTNAKNEKYPFSTKELRNELKHTFWILDRVSSAKALKKLLENHPTFENYGIVLAVGSENAYESGDEGTENLRSLAAVRKAIVENEKTITLSVGQLTTGVTVPEWTGVIMLCNMKSPAQYMQAAFRAQNPYSWTEKGKHYRKERVYVFDFAPERTLIIYDKFANDLSMATANGHGTTDERKENIGELLNFFPVIAEDSSGRMVEIDAAQVMTIPKQIKAQEVVKRGFMSNLLFDNIASIFRATQTVLDILSDLPEASQGKVVMGNDDIDIVDVDLDDDDNPIIPDEIVINKQEALFGDKLRSSIKNIENTIRNEDLKPTLEDMLARVTAPVITPIVQEMQETYGLKNRAAQRIEKDIKDAIKTVAEENDKAQNVAIAHKEAEYKEKIEAAKSEEEKLAIETEREEVISAVKVEYKDKFTKDISTTLQELPKQIIKQQEVEALQNRMNSDEEKIRGHLRGFARTIPSFLMAYGDEQLTLDNFDTYVDEDVFHEVTGITLDQFRYLRDGGDGFNGHLFDAPTFNEAILEFLRKKAELANYFEDNKEDIFDYIPPQQTNQIFTPKKVVKRMVDELEKENPDIFDDSTKTYIDLYMKSGLYIAELVKRLYNNESMRKQFPDDAARLKHILENQVYGFAPSAIIYRIATNFIFGPIGDDVSRKNFVQADTIPYAKEGRIQLLIEKSFN